MIPLKYPLKSLTYSTKTRFSPEAENLLKDELNVKEVKWNPDENGKISFDSSYDENLESEYHSRLEHRNLMQARKEKGLKYYE